jgi:hypothetical protein
MGSAKVFHHRHKQNVRKSLSGIKHFGMGDASRQCHSTFIIQSECTTITVLARGRLVRISFENQRPCPEMQSVDLPAVCERYNRRGATTASTTAFRSSLPCKLRELDQPSDGIDDPAPMLF